LAFNRWSFEGLRKCKPNTAKLRFFNSNPGCQFHALSTIACGGASGERAGDCRMKRWYSTRNPMENTFAVELNGAHCVTLANDQPIPAGEVGSFSFHETRTRNPKCVAVDGGCAA